MVTIGTAIINIVFAHKNGVDDQGTWTTCITQVLIGIGLMFAGDQATSKASHDDTLNQLASIKKDVATTATAASTGNTELLQKVAVSNAASRP